MLSDPPTMSLTSTVRGAGKIYFTGRGQHSAKRWYCTYLRLEEKNLTEGVNMFIDVKFCYSG